MADDKLDAHQSFAAHLTNQILILRAERDALKADRDRIADAAKIAIEEKDLRLSEAYVEQDRLRTALEEIAEDPTGVSSYQQEIARRALEECGITNPETTKTRNNHVKTNSPK
jgi:hypothetical protein